MSAALKLSLKSQTGKKKIDSPLAKYNSLGQLFCVLCNSQVKNEIFWTAHVNGKQHRENLLQLKTKKTTSEQTPQPAPAADPHVFKRPAPRDNNNESEPAPKITRLEDKNRRIVEQAELELDRLGNEQIVDDTAHDEEEEQQQEQHVEEEPPPKHLPEGFFDDPKEDAKARGQKFKDPNEAEWERFVKEIASEDLKSTEMVGKDEQVTSASRELDQIEEQMVAWQRVILLEKKAEELGKLRKHGSSQMEVDEHRQLQQQNEDDEEEEEDIEYDEEMDWRNKKR